MHPGGPNSGSVLETVTVVGDLDLTTPSARMRIQNGLALTGGKVRLNNNGAIGFEGTQTFAGEILFEGDTGFLGIEGNSTLTLGPTAWLHGKSGRIGPAIFVGGTSGLVNQGRISADVAAGTLTVNLNIFTNTGTLEELNGATWSLRDSHDLVVTTQPRTSPRLIP